MTPTCEAIKHLCDPLPGSPKRYPTGRVCAYPGCGTVLNPYNKAGCCYRHDGWKAERPRKVTAAELELDTFGTKICCRCEAAKPATTDYFAIDNSRRDGLRCMCKACKRASDRARAQAKRGPDAGLTDAGPVRDHIRALVTAGMSYTAIARATGCVGEHMVANILYGVTKQVRLRNARAILGVEVET